MNTKSLFKLFRFLVTLIGFVVAIYLLIGTSSNDSILETYDSIKPDSTSGLSKNLIFVQSYTGLTGDTSLALSIGMSEDDADEMASGSYNLASSIGSTGSATISADVPTDLNELLAAVQTAQAAGSSSGSTKSCNAVFALLYPNSSYTYSDLKQWQGDSITGSTIRSLNSQAMSSIQVDVWQWANPNPTSTDLTKVSATINVQCCTTLQPIIKQIFKEIYESADQPVITVAGGYCVREMNNSSSSHSTSTHSYGGTIDINYSDQKGNEVSWNWNTNNGSSDRPYPRSYENWSKLTDNQYKYTCIYKGCTIMQIFEKYGLYWRGNWGKSSCDPMHFSVFNH
jgi:hypothetical protein